MKVLIIFDSYFGNTEQIGEAIAKPFPDATVKRIREIEFYDLLGYDLIIIGSPTRGFRPTESTSGLIQSLPRNGLKNVKSAVFDTRIELDTINSKFMRKFVNFGGYAAPHMAKKLRRKGVEIVINPEGFYVLDTEGPLKEGELERAEQWGRNILKSI